MTVRDNLPTAITSIVFAVLLIASATVPAAAHGESHAKEGLTVKLQDDGDAKLTLALTYNLSSDTERKAFSDIEQNTSVREDVKTSFKNRMQTLVEKSSNRTDRQMSLKSVSISTKRVDDSSTGVVKLSAVWTNLAQQKDGKLIVTAPFTNYTPQGQFKVVSPDGYKVVSVTPNPYIVLNNNIQWQAGTSLDNFKLVLEQKQSSQTTTEDTGSKSGDQSQSDSGSSSSGGQPGFGLAAALIGMIGAVFAVRRYQS